MTTDPNGVGRRAATATDPQPSVASNPSLLGPASGLTRWTAFGTGVGIEIRERELRVTIVRLRPWETGVLGSATVPDFRNRPAGEWGTELGTFLRKIGAGHIAATVLLRRTDVIVRQVHLPGVANRDLAAAVQLQIDTLHPFSDEDVYFSWARLGKSPWVLVGISRRSTIDSYLSMFAEAGVKVASFTFSAATLYSATRMITSPPEAFVAVHQVEGEVEVYGESPSRPPYSAALPIEVERAVGVTKSELRLGPDDPAVHLSEILPKPVVFPADHDPSTPAFEANALPYATALAGACPWLGVQGNLLPPSLRRTSSRVRLIPTIVLASTLVILVIALAFRARLADARYLGLLQHEISRYETQARRVEALDRRILATRERSQSLDEFRRRPKLDIDAISDITKLISPPGWVSSLDMDRNLVQIGGEAEQAAPLLSAFDKSLYFEKSEFTMPISRSAAGDMFRIKAQRQTPPLMAAPRQTAQAPGPEQPAATPAPGVSK